MTDVELRALEVAYGGGDEHALGALYGICAQVGEGAWDYVQSEQQKQELRGALVLCPDHPDRAFLSHKI
jgi:hypothetical protein